MAKSIWLGYGKRTTSVILDMVTGNLVAYDGSDEFHKKYGGRRYPDSLSSVEGLGFIEQNSTVRKVNTYRVDASLIEFPRAARVRPTIGGIFVYAPIDQSKRKISEAFPVILIDGKETVMVSHRDMFKILKGETISMNIKEQDMTISFLKKTEDVFKTKRLYVKYLGFSLGKVKRVMGALLRHEVSFEWPEGSRSKSKSLFWNRLGFFPIEGKLYKIAKRICTAVYTKDELDKDGRLQQVVPANVFILGSRFYIQEDRGGTFTAVAQFNFKEGEQDVVLPMNLRQAVLAMKRDRGEVGKVVDALRKKAFFLVEKTH